MDLDLPTKLLAEARSHVAGKLEQPRLLPFHEAVLTYRAKRTSYEQICQRLKRHGIRVSPSAVGNFCRRYFTSADIERARRQLISAATGEPGPLPILRGVPVLQSGAAKKRSPRIARDDF